MKTVTVHFAKTNLSGLLVQVEKGEEILVSRGKEPIARIVPYRPAPINRCFGSHKGSVSVGAEFFDPLPETELSAWE
jgi:prevent-host-death family protein